MSCNVALDALAILRVSTFGYSDLKRLSPGIPILFTEHKWILDTISISNSVTEWRQSMMDRELAGSPCCWRQQARRCWYHRWKQKEHGLARFNKFTKMGSGVFCCIIGGRGSFRKSYDFNYDGRRACWPNVFNRLCCIFHGKRRTKIPTRPQNVSGCRLCNRSVICWGHTAICLLDKREQVLGYARSLMWTSGVREIIL